MWKTKKLLTQNVEDKMRMEEQKKQRNEEHFDKEMEKQELKMDRKEMQCEDRFNVEVNKKVEDMEKRHTWEEHLEEVKTKEKSRPDMGYHINEDVVKGGGKQKIKSYKNRISLNRVPLAKGDVSKLKTQAEKEHMESSLKEAQSILKLIKENVQRSVENDINKTEVSIKQFNKSPGRLKQVLPKINKNEVLEIDSTDQKEHSQLSKVSAVNSKCKLLSIMYDEETPLCDHFEEKAVPKKISITKRVSIPKKVKAPREVATPKIKDPRKQSGKKESLIPVSPTIIAGKKKNENPSRVDLNQEVYKEGTKLSGTECQLNTSITITCIPLSEVNKNKLSAESKNKDGTIKEKTKKTPVKKVTKVPSMPPKRGRPSKKDLASNNNDISNSKCLEELRIGCDDVSKTDEKGPKIISENNVSKIPKKTKENPGIVRDTIVSEEEEDMTNSKPLGNRVAKRKHSPSKVQTGTKVNNQVHITDIDLDSNHAIPSTSNIHKKSTRSLRKVKKSVEFIIDCDDKSESDIEVDFSDDEYVPPNEDMLSDEESDSQKENFENNVPDKRKYRKKSTENRAKKVTPPKMKEVKPRKPRTKPVDSQSQGDKKTKARKSSPRNKGQRKTKTRSQPDGNQDQSQKENIMDMPLLTPGRVRSPKKKRKLRVLKEKMTFLDHLDLRDYTSDEDAFEEEQTVAEDEGEATKQKKKKRRRRLHGVPYSVTGNWYIASGYLFDITNLLDEFNKVDSWRFKDFAKCWQKYNFSLVYRGRQNFKELLEFSEEVALLTKRFLMPPHSVKVQIGALYTLYGLYYKHPFRHFFKIRLTKEEYKHLLEIIKSFQTNQDNPDPAFVFRKLEVDGGILHVATSLEVGFDFYCADREAVDIKYESQRLASTSALRNALSTEYLADDDKLLRHYHHIKTVAMGDGNAPEKAVAFVDPSVTAEVENWIAKVKENSIKILKLKDVPPLIKPPVAPHSEISEIGGRRADIIAKAVQIEPGTVKSGSSHEEKRGKSKFKCVRRRSRKLKQSSDETGVNDSTAKEFMKIPTHETLNMPLKPIRKSQRKVPHKFIKRDINENNEKKSIENGQGTGDLEISCDAVIDSDIFNVVPDVVPPPKRIRPRARKAALFEALEKPKAPALSNIQILRKTMRAKILVENKHKVLSIKASPLGSSYSKEEMPVIPVTKLETQNPPLIELPPDETAIIYPIKVEKYINNSDSDFSFFDSSTYPESTFLDDSSRADLTESEVEDEQFINLNIHFSGENVDERDHVRILAQHWNAIENDERKKDKLKKKLLGTMLSPKVQDGLKEGKHIDVDISPVIVKQEELPTMRKSSMEIRQYPDSQPLMSPKKEMHSPHKGREGGRKNKDTPVSNVIKELQDLWAADDEEDELEVKPIAEGFDITIQLNKSVCKSNIPVTQNPAARSKSKRQNSSNDVRVNTSADVRYHLVASLSENDLIDVHDNSDMDVELFEDNTPSPNNISEENDLSQVYPHQGNYAYTSVANVTMPNVLVQTSSDGTFYRHQELDLVSLGSTSKPLNSSVPIYHTSTHLPISPTQDIMLPQQATCNKPVITPASSIYHVQQNPSMYKIMTQPPTTITAIPTKFPGSVSVSHIQVPVGHRTPVAFPHNPSMGSIEGLRSLPNPSNSKFVKVKINDKSIFVPADRLVTSATKVNYLSEMKQGANSHQADAVVKVDHPWDGQTNPVNSLNTFVNRTELKSFNGAFIPCTPVAIVKQNDNKEVTERTAKANIEEVITLASGSPSLIEPGSSKGRGRVCSFLFSPKFKVLSGIMKEAGVGQATGTPVIPKRQNVPFLLKHSLVPKKKKI